MPLVSTFETGANQWKNYKTWSLKQAQEKNLYFLPNRKLSFEALKTNASFNSYISDLDKPVPFTNGTLMDMDREYMTAGQRFAATRPNVLTYQTDVLSEDLRWPEISGQI